MEGNVDVGVDASWRCRWDGGALTTSPGAAAEGGSAQEAAKRGRWGSALRSRAAEQRTESAAASRPEKDADETTGRSGAEQASGYSLFTPVTPAQRTSAERGPAPNPFAPGLRTPTPSAPTGKPASPPPSAQPPTPPADTSGKTANTKVRGARLRGLKASGVATPDADQPDTKTPGVRVSKPEPRSPQAPKTTAAQPPKPDARGGAPARGGEATVAALPVRPRKPGTRDGQAAAGPARGAEASTSKPDVQAASGAEQAADVTARIPLARRPEEPAGRVEDVRAPEAEASGGRAPSVERRSAGVVNAGAAGARVAEGARGAAAPTRDRQVSRGVGAAGVQGAAASEDGTIDFVVPSLPERAGRKPPGALFAFLAVAVTTVAAHAIAATFTSLWIATAGEARFAVAVLAVRDATITQVSLALWDRLAAIQIAAVQLLLPAGDPVELARWACLALGALATLLAWPALRGFGNSVPAAAVAVGTLGAALPILALHSGVTTAVAGVVWLSLAAALAVRNRIRAAGIAALLAVVTVPLVAAPLLGMAAYVCLDGTVRLPARLRTPAGISVAIVAAGVVLAAVLPGAPFVATAGPAIPMGIALAGAALAAVVAVVALIADPLLRPVLAAAAPLVAVWLVPGPSQAAAGILIAPVVAVALGVLVDQVRERVRRRSLRMFPAAIVAVVVVVPLIVAARWPTPAGGSLARWVTTQAGPDTIVVADTLDRAELQIAGFPEPRLRTPADPPVPGELRVVSERPGAAAVAPCPPEAVLAQTPTGSGGAPAVVCGALTPASAVEARVRARLGAQLTTNSALQLQPDAVDTLRNGDVDPRLMLTLAALTSAHSVGVTSFPAVGLDAPGALRRMVVLSSFDGAAPSSSQLLRTWLAAQQAPFAPAGVVADGADLILNYPAPSPTGLLPL